MFCSFVSSADPVSATLLTRAPHLVVDPREQRHKGLDHAPYSVLTGMTGGHRERRIELMEHGDLLVYAGSRLRKNIQTNGTTQGTGENASEKK